jgi:small subunit ribosomal protein S16
MPTKIRLQRKGKKGQPFYHIVAADGRAPRDGKFIEKLGTYNPMTHPASIELDFDRALYWVQVGAQPTDTARSILSREGVMLKHHLFNGVKKGALTNEQVEEKFQAWLKEKAEKLAQAAKDADLSEKELKKKRAEEEKKINEVRAEALAKKYAKESVKESKESEESTEETEETPENTEKAPEAESKEPTAEVSETESKESSEETPEPESKENNKETLKDESKENNKETLKDESKETKAE